jgi:uncharacterized protein YkwD
VPTPQEVLTAMPSLGRPSNGSTGRRPRRFDLTLSACALSVVTTVSSLGLVTGTATPAQATVASTLYETQAFAATNVQRIARARVVLRPRACLHKWAVRQARRMAEREEMFHQSLQRVATDCGLSYAGENVAYGYGSGAAVVRAWMNSAGHRANILNRHYRGMGIGAWRSADGTWYVSQVFGRRAG